MCKPEERFFVIGNWSSYMLRGVGITSPSGTVVAVPVLVSVSRMGLWV